MANGKAIVVGNGKGGVGKSCFAANAIVDLNDRGFPTVGFDGEKNTWPLVTRLNAFDESLQVFPIETLEECLAAVRQATSGGYNVVIDWAGELTAEVEHLSRIADLWVIPFTFGEQELIQTRPTVTLLRAQQLLQDGKPDAWIFFNETRKRDASIKKYRTLLEPMGLPIAESRLRKLDEYRDFRSVLRDPSHDRNGAATDFRHLMDEIVMPCFFREAANA